MKHSPGFSLSELTVWMALIGLVASFSSLPLVGLLPTIRVDHAIRGVAALLEWTRFRAIMEGCSYVVAFSGKDNSVQVYRDPSCGSSTTEKSVRTLNIDQEYPGIILGSAAGVSRTGSCAPVDAEGLHIPYQRVIFLPSGTSDRCGSLYLIPARDLPDRRDRMRALSILLATGRIQLWRFNPDTLSPCSGTGSWEPF